MSSVTSFPSIRRNVARKSTSNRPLKYNLKTDEHLNCTQVNIKSNILQLSGFSHNDSNLNQNSLEHILCSNKSCASVTNACISKFSNKSVHVKETRTANDVTCFQDASLAERQIEEEVETEEDDGIFIPSSFMVSYLNDSLPSPAISQDSSDEVVGREFVLNYPEERGKSENPGFTEQNGSITPRESCDTENDESLLLNIKSIEQNGDDDNCKTDGSLCYVFGNRVVEECDLVTAAVQNDESKDVPVKMIVCHAISENGDQNEIIPEGTYDSTDESVDNSFIKVVSVTTLGDSSFESLESDTTCVDSGSTDTKVSTASETTVNENSAINKKSKKRKLRTPKIFFGSRKKKKKEKDQKSTSKHQNSSSSVSDLSSENVSPNASNRSEDVSSPVTVENISDEPLSKRRTRSSSHLNNEEVTDSKITLEKETIKEKKQEKETSKENKLEKEIWKENKLEKENSKENKTSGTKNKPDIKQVAATKGIMLLSDSCKEVAVIQQGSTVINDKDALLKLNPSKIDEDTLAADVDEENDVDIQQSLTEEILLEQALRMARLRTSPRRKPILSKFEERRLIQSILNSIPNKKNKRTTKNSLKTSEVTSISNQDELNSEKSATCEDSAPREENKETKENSEEQSPAVNESSKISSSPKKKKKKASFSKKKKKQGNSMPVLKKEEIEKISDEKVTSVKCESKQDIENICENVENSKTKTSDDIQCNIVESTDPSLVDESPSSSKQSRETKDIPEKGPVSIDLASDDIKPEPEPNIPFISSSTKEENNLEHLYNEAQNMTSIVSGQMHFPSAETLHFTQTPQPTVDSPRHYYSSHTIPFNTSSMQRQIPFSPQDNRFYYSTPMSSPYYQNFKMEESFQNSAVNFPNVYAPYMSSPSLSEDSPSNQRISSPARTENISSPIPTKTMHDVPLSILIRDPRLKKRSALLPTPQTSPSIINLNLQSQSMMSTNFTMGKIHLQAPSHNSNSSLGVMNSNPIISLQCQAPNTSVNMAVGNMQTFNPALLSNQSSNMLSTPLVYQPQSVVKNEILPKPLMSLTVNPPYLTPTKDVPPSHEQVNDEDSRGAECETKENFESPERKKIKKKKDDDPELQYKTPLSDLHDIPERTSSYSRLISKKTLSNYDSKKDSKVPRRKESTETIESISEDVNILDKPTFEEPFKNRISSQYPILGRLAEMIRTETSEPPRHELRHSISEYPPAYQRLQDFKKAEVTRKKDLSRSSYKSEISHDGRKSIDFSDCNRSEEARCLNEYSHEFRRNEDTNRSEEYQSPYRRPDEYPPEHWRNREFSPEYRRSEEHDRESRWPQNYSLNYRNSEEYANDFRPTEDHVHQESEELSFTRKRERIHDDSAYSRFEYAHKRVDGRFPTESGTWKESEIPRDRYKRADRELSWTEEDERDLIEGPEIPYSRRKRNERYSSNRPPNWKNSPGSVELYERRSGGNNRNWKDDTDLTSVRDKYVSRKPRKDFDERKKSSSKAHRERENKRETSPTLESPLSPDPEFVPYEEPVYLPIPQ